MNKHVFNEIEYGTKEEIFENHENIMCYTFSRITNNDGIEIGKKFLYREYTIEELTGFAQEKLNQKVILGRADCFAVVNRGALWYDLLTETQKLELKTWYQEWLDITDKPLEYIPVKPDWIK